MYLSFVFHGSLFPSLILPTWSYNEMQGHISTRCYKKETPTIFNFFKLKNNLSIDFFTTTKDSKVKNL